MSSLCCCFQLLTAHLQKHSEALLELEKTCRSSRKLEVLCRDFELQKVCYLPLNIIFLRPLHRLMHYKQILERLCKHYPPTHDDFRDSRGTSQNEREIRHSRSSESHVSSLSSSRARWRLWDGGAASRDPRQDGKLPETSRAEERSYWCRESCCSWTGLFFYWLFLNMETQSDLNCSESVWCWLFV